MAGRAAPHSAEPGAAADRRRGRAQGLTPAFSFAAASRKTPANHPGRDRRLPGRPHPHQAVAERAGISRAALYQYFPGKRDLFAAIYRQAADRRALSRARRPVSLRSHRRIGGRTGQKVVWTSSPVSVDTPPIPGSR
ncbi:TetR/AcrR family transcriptional regulator [Amycolatopsis sp. NBC_00345]|uniref:helix-turn-helix domain-containing protein n=1 Tax=Amycolatopsis sp. NBC_00345 TaxID=2975955 RepID=UPI002E274424